MNLYDNIIYANKPIFKNKIVVPAFISWSKFDDLRSKFISNNDFIPITVETT